MNDQRTDKFDTSASRKNSANTEKGNKKEFFNDIGENYSEITEAGQLRPSTKKNIAIALDTTILLLTPGSNKDSDHQKNGGTTTIPDKLIAMQKTPTFDQIDKPRGEEWRITNRCGLESFLVALSGHYNFYALTTWPEKKTAFILEKANISSYFAGSFRKQTQIFVPGTTQKEGSELANTSRTIIIDSSRDQISYNTTNGILIRPFTKETDDGEDLFDLIPFLIYLNQFDDIRPIKNYYNYYNQQSKKMRGPFGPFKLPAEIDASSSSDESTSEDDEYNVRGTTSIGGSILDLKARIMQGHITSGNQKTGKSPSQTTIKHDSSFEYTNKYADIPIFSKNILDKPSLSEINPKVQSPNLFSRTNFAVTRSNL